jgi:hypothetical protein
MAKTLWRTVSCADDKIRKHPSQEKAYTWVADQEQGVRFRVQYDEQLGAGWRLYATVSALGDGRTEELL